MVVSVTEAIGGYGYGYPYSSSYSTYATTAYPDTTAVAAVDQVQPPATDTAGRRQ